MTVGSTPMQSVGEFRRTVKRSKNTGSFENALYVQTSSNFWCISKLF